MYTYFVHLTIDNHINVYVFNVYNFTHIADVH